MFEGLIDLIHLDDAEIFLTRLPSQSIDLVITSPPFYAEEIYIVNKKPEFGWNNYREYIDHLDRVLEQLFRILRDSAKVCLILSNTPIIGKNEISGLYPITFDVYNCARNHGFTLFSEIIWHKTESSYLDTEIKNLIPNSQPSYNHDTMIVLEKPGTNITVDEVCLSPSVWTLPAAGPVEEYNEVYNCFPEKLIQNCIEMWSIIDNVVLDPYAGSGQVVRVALKNQRRAIGVETDKRWQHLWNDVNDNNSSPP